GRTAAGEPGGRGGHGRPRPGGAAAAAAEDRDEPTSSVGLERRQNGPERIGGMGVINANRPTAGTLGDELHAAGNRGQIGESLDGAGYGATGCDHQSESGEGVHRLEFADQRQHQLVPLPYYLKDEDLAAGSR